MKVKVLALVAMLFAGIMTVSAQERGDLRLGVTAGMNVANITDTEMDSRIGFNIGGRAEYNFTESVYGNVGLLFTLKGERKEVGGLTKKRNPVYLEIPIHVGYRYSLGNSISLFGETGPYFALGLGGKTKYSYSGSSSGRDWEDWFGAQPMYDDYDGYYDDEDFGADSSSKFFGKNRANRFDAGWGFRAGVEFSKFQVSLGYEIGFERVFDGKFTPKGDPARQRNSNFMVGVSYMF